MSKRDRSDWVRKQIDNVKNGTTVTVSSAATLSGGARPSVPRLSATAPVLGKVDKSDWVKKQRVLTKSVNVEVEPVAKTVVKVEPATAVAKPMAVVKPMAEVKPVVVIDPDVVEVVPAQKVDPPPRRDLHWKPDNIRDVVGNTKAKDELNRWLHGRQFHKPVLLSGPTGIGKSVLARAALRSAGYTQIIECVQVQILVDASRRAPRPRELGIVFDELDAVDATERTALVRAIKDLPRLSPPVVCICDNAHDKHMDSLRNACLSIRMFRPFDPASDAIALIRILVREWQLGTRVSLDTQRAIVNTSHGDLRRVTIATHWAARTGARIAGESDVVFDTAFDGVRALMTKKVMTSETAQAAAHDSFATLLVHENYVGHCDLFGMTALLSDVDLLDSHFMHHTHTHATVLLATAVPTLVTKPWGARDRIAFTRFFAHRPSSKKHGEHDALLKILTDETVNNKT